MTGTTTATAITASPDAIDKAVMEVIRVRRNAPGTLPAGTQTTHISIHATPTWPDGPAVKVAVHRRGTGPAVLLVHGKQSQTSDFGTLADALVDAGFSVWSPDMPGHGHSDGQYLSLPMAARVIHEVARMAGPLTSAVGHSFGAACMVQAMFEGLAPSSAILIASPTHYGVYARFTAQKAGLKEADMPAFMQRLQAIIGDDPDSMDLSKQISRIHARTLVLHSTDDRVVPSSPIERIAERWESAQWRALQGLGHFRILNDPQVLQTIVGFAQENTVQQ